MSSFSDIFHDLKSSGSIVSPRGQRTLELTDYLAKFKPYERFANFPSRKLSLPYIKKELLWYLRGDKYDLSICESAKLWQQMIYDGQLHSNYGQYIFTGSQLDYVVGCLLNDHDSRRAVMSIMGKEHLFLKNTDVPCTMSLGFRIRDGKLCCTVTMRSTDAVYGMSNDIPFFSFVHEAVLVRLNGAQSGERLELGGLTLFTNSLHVYERHWPMLNRLLTERVEPVDCPRLSGPDEVANLRRGYSPAAYSTACPPFTAWLHNAT